MNLISRIIEKIINANRKVKVTYVIVLDTISSIFSTGLAFIVRLDLETLTAVSSNLLFPFILSFVLFLPIFYWCNIYNTIFRYFDVANIKSLVFSVILYALPFFFIIYFYAPQGVPRSIGIIQPLIFFAFIIINRIFAIAVINSISVNKYNKNILIYGAGEAGVQLQNIISKTNDYKLIGFLDDDVSKIGRSIYQNKIFSTKSIPDLIKRYRINEVFLSISNLKIEEKKLILKKLEEYNLKTKILPNINKILKGTISISDFREVSVLDLVERKIKIDNKEVDREFLNKTVLITGAGGSIGSHLSVQIIRFNPKELIILDNSEYNLYLIEQKLKKIIDENNLNTRLITKLVDISKDILIDKIFLKFKPSFVFHAAAYKHVPLVEKNIIEAIQNNFIGTKKIIDISLKHNCKKFILISTDKAVRPSNIMGATKRLSEMYVQAVNNSNISSIRGAYSIVRFGNVLDSSGSVVPLFRKQINDGGPLTVTSPDVTRYFMTIPEAASLILRSMTYSKGGEIFILDMGEPIKILSLAKKMIKLSGLTDKIGFENSIEIIFTGLREGEKLHEELFIDKKNTKRLNKDILYTQEDHLNMEEFKNIENELSKIIYDSNEKKAIMFLKKNVKGFNYN